MKIPSRLQLADIPTPVQQVFFEDFMFPVKRDDYTGVEFSGNKIRKLEYLLYDALHYKAEYIFTCGGEQSNHARAAAAGAVKYGMKPVLFLWGRDRADAGGNLFINKFIGADIRFLSKQDYDNVNNIMAEEKKKYEASGKKVYVIPEGGSTTLGMWGYINFINEFIKQVDINKVKNIYVAAGTGGNGSRINGRCCSKQD